MRPIMSTILFVSFFGVTLFSVFANSKKCEDTAANVVRPDFKQSRSAGARAGGVARVMNFGSIKEGADKQLDRISTILQATLARFDVALSKDGIDLPNDIKEELRPLFHILDCIEKVTPRRGLRTFNATKRSNLQADISGLRKKTEKFRNEQLRLFKRGNRISLPNSIKDLTRFTGLLYGRVGPNWQVTSPQGAIYLLGQAESEIKEASQLLRVIYQDEGLPNYDLAPVWRSTGEFRHRIQSLDLAFAKDIFTAIHMDSAQEQLGLIERLLEDYNQLEIRVRFGGRTVSQFSRELFQLVGIIENLYD